MSKKGQLYFFVEQDSTSHGGARVPCEGAQRVKRLEMAVVSFSHRIRNGSGGMQGRRQTVLYEFSGKKKKGKKMEKMHPKHEFKKLVQFNHPMEPSKTVSTNVECFSRTAYTYLPLGSTEIWIFQFNKPLIGTRVYHYTTIPMINCYYCMQL